MLECFEKGDREGFFKFFSRLAISPSKAKELELARLEFDLQLYFLVYRTHPLLVGRLADSRLDGEACGHFLAYLENKGKAMSKREEYIGYYALPYVAEPQSHKSFKHLFEQKWVNGLEADLKRCLNVLFFKNKPPKIF